MRALRAAGADHAGSLRLVGKRFPTTAEDHQPTESRKRVLQMLLIGLIVGGVAGYFLRANQQKVVDYLDTKPWLSWFKR